MTSNRILTFAATLCITTATFAQAPDSATTTNAIYQATAQKVNDLVHTKLDVRFDYKKAYLYGKAWITLKPHFYPTDTLTLDAKGMNINSIMLWNNGVGRKLNFTYPDSLQLKIKLDRTYTEGELYTIFIDYTARPNDLKEKGSEAITDAKGLYFINPRGKTKGKPVEIWTQGETEASSAWFPTIDKPNQKTTSEIVMTVPQKYVSLSNGLLTNQVNNPDGTRTDTWKMDLPHSPYLFFMGVGDFSVVKDAYKDKEVSYYVEKPYENVARQIFGLTPEMIAFYSKKLGVDYPWPKYSQMVGRDYVSGAMENTTATLHSEYLQQNARQLTDGNKYEEYISHELFHQWFGDLVTAESWSNLTVNESFADFSETLWNEYKHGQDAGDEHSYSQMQLYLNSKGENKNLVRFYYDDKEDMFDRVTYEKGGRILYMLRNFVGEDAFFRSLNLYLSTYKFKNAEAQQLRLAFEEVTGKDLNWFWNQWYYGSGHPKLNIHYGYDSASAKATVIVAQQQSGQTFTLPVSVDIYSQSGEKSRYSVWVRSKADTFSFDCKATPALINFDGDKVLLGVKTENKTLDEFIFQYQHPRKYVDRREAIDFAVAHKSDDKSKDFLLTALRDPFPQLRRYALEKLKPIDVNPPFITAAETIATGDTDRLTRAAAIDFLGETRDTKYRNQYLTWVRDSSYSVAGAALHALSLVDQKQAKSLLKTLKRDARGRLEDVIDELEEGGKKDDAQ